MAAESQEAGNIALANSTAHKRKGTYALFKKGLKLRITEKLNTSLKNSFIFVRYKTILLNKSNVFTTKFHYQTNYKIDKFVEH